MCPYDHAHFENLYRKDIDPWGFRSNPYEAEKYAATLAALPMERFHKGLELGCSIGVLTRALAMRCDALVAVDTSSVALAEAARHCHSLDVDFRQAHLPDGEFGLGFDLVVVSEVLYFLEASSLRTLAHRIARVVRPGALCIGVHWTGATDFPLSGDEAARRFFEAAEVSCLSHRAFPRYRLDVGRFGQWSRHL